MPSMLKKNIVRFIKIDQYLLWLSTFVNVGKIKTTDFTLVQVLSKVQLCGCYVVYSRCYILVMMWSASSLSRSIQRLATSTTTGCRKMHDSSTLNSSSQVVHPSYVFINLFNFMHQWAVTGNFKSEGICREKKRKSLHFVFFFVFLRNKLLFSQPWLCPLEADC